MSSKFTDALGREWVIKISIGDLKPLKEAGLDLAALAKDGEQFVERLFLRAHELGPVFYMLCKKQATGLGFAVTEADFLDALDGDAFDAALVAFWQAFGDFFRHCPIGVRIRSEGAAAAMKLVEGTILNAMTATPADPTPTPAPAADPATPAA